MLYCFIAPTIVAPLYLSFAYAMATITVAQLEGLDCSDIFL